MTTLATLRALAKAVLPDARVTVRGPYDVGYDVEIGSDEHGRLWSRL